MRRIFSNWKSRRRNNTIKAKGKGKQKGKHLSNGAGKHLLWLKYSGCIYNRSNFSPALFIGPTKSKSTLSDYDDVNSDDDEESSKEQKKKSADVSVPGTCIYFSKLLLSIYVLCIMKEVCHFMNTLYKYSE